MPASQIYQVTKTLNNVQIIALPTTPIVIVPPTEVLEYSGTPTQVPFPTLSFFSVNTLAGLYTNVDAGGKFVFQMGSDQSADLLSVDHGYLGNPLTNAEVRMFRAQTTASLVSLPAAPADPHAHPFDGISIKLSDNLEDNALVLWFNNNGDGVFTGGHASNSLKLTMFYTIIDV